MFLHLDHTCFYTFLSFMGVFLICIFFWLQVFNTLCSVGYTWIFSRFTCGDQGSEISVVQYFDEKYGIALRYPALPALQAGNDKRPVFLPMEVHHLQSSIILIETVGFLLFIDLIIWTTFQLCSIAEGQRFSRKLNEKQVTQLLKANCQRPHDRENGIKVNFR